MSGHTTALQAAVDAWNAHDRDRYVAAYTSDAPLHGFPPEITDPASLGDFFTAIWASVPDARIDVDEVLEEGDRLAARLTMRGTHEGELLGVPASHRRFEFSVMTILRFDDDERIAERWNTADFLGLLQQIGGVPAPA